MCIWACMCQLYTPYRKLIPTAAYSCIALPFLNILDKVYIIFNQGDSLSNLMDRDTLFINLVMTSPTSEHKHHTLVLLWNDWKSCELSGISADTTYSAK